MRKIIVILLTLTLLITFTACSNIEFINSTDESSGIEIIGEPEITVTDDSDIGNTWYNLHITGTCKNNSEYDYTSVSFIFYFYDIDNNELEMIVTFIDDIKSGEEAKLYAEDIIYKEDYENIHWYELQDIYTSKDSDPTQEDIDDALRNEAVKANFVEINAGNWKSKKVYAEGEVSALDTSNRAMYQFTLAMKENGGYGIYLIKAFTTLPNNAALDILNNGDTIRVYGTVSGKDENTSMPIISVTVIEFR
jgi:hypothetical protein